ncbi:MAG: ArsR family transcriptional regulator [Anaerolineales bacterium]|jgi:ArsR family transcriptional regulator|nr:ArsR family transcriptional regulator [Anaerolineales bacterium]
MDKQIFSNEQLSDLARWLKVICEPRRLLLLEKIIEGVQCNCDLGDALLMAPNLTSHHLGILREAGLVDVVRDPVDARWGYYSINLKAMEELMNVFCDFFDPDRIQPRRLNCGPLAMAGYRQNLLKLEK